MKGKLEEEGDGEVIARGGGGRWEVERRGERERECEWRGKGGGWKKRKR